MKNHAATVVAIILGMSMYSALAQEIKPYKDGPVTNVSYIKIKPGKFDEYMKYLSGSYKQLMEDNKKAGLILSYNIYSAQARSPREADLILTTTYPNMASFDKDEEFDAASAKVMGNSATRSKKAIDRESLREVLGSELIREMVLK